MADKLQDLLLSHYSTARLRLFDPLLNDTKLSTVANPNLVPPLRSDAEALDPYHAGTSVLRSWVNNWLAIPVCYYFHMPQPGYGHFIYGVTMLARQARLSLLANAQPNCASSIPSNAPIGADQHATKNADAEATKMLVLSSLETFTARFEAAREEMGAAHGQKWGERPFRLDRKDAQGQDGSHREVE